MSSSKPSKLYRTDTESEHSSEGSEPTSAVVLRDYLEDNYTLFALIGIFGALAVYFNQLNKELGSPQSLRLGIVGCLAVVLVIVLLLTSDLLHRVGGGNEVLNLLFSRENKHRSLLLFLLPFGAVVHTFMSVIANFSTSLSILFQFGAWILGFIAMVKLAFNFADSIKIRDRSVNLFSGSFISSIKNIILLSLILSGFKYAINQIRAEIQAGIGNSRYLYVDNGDLLEVMYHGFTLGAESYILFLILVFSTFTILFNCLKAIEITEQKIECLLVWVILQGREKFQLI